VNAGLFVNRGQGSSLGSLLRSQRGTEVDLNTLGNLILNFHGVAENVRGGPGLREG
jgi:hypothetical protein